MKGSGEWGALGTPEGEKLQEESRAKGIEARFVLIAMELISVCGKIHSFMVLTELDANQFDPQVVDREAKSL